MIGQRPWLTCNNVHLVMATLLPPCCTGLWSSMTFEGWLATRDRTLMLYFCIMEYFLTRGFSACDDYCRLNLSSLTFFLPQPHNKLVSLLIAFSNKFCYDFFQCMQIIGGLTMLTVTRVKSDKSLFSKVKKWNTGKISLKCEEWRLAIVKNGAKWRLSEKQDF